MDDARQRQGSAASVIPEDVYCLNVKLCIKPERRDEVRANFEARRLTCLRKPPRRAMSALSRART